MKPETFLSFHSQISICFGKIDIIAIDIIWRRTTGGKGRVSREICHYLIFTGLHDQAPRRDGVSQKVNHNFKIFHAQNRNSLSWSFPLTFGRQSLIFRPFELYANYI